MVRYVAKERKEYFTSFKSIKDWIEEKEARINSENTVPNNYLLKFIMKLFA